MEITREQSREKLDEGRALARKWGGELNCYTFQHGVQCLTPQPTKWGWVAYKVTNVHAPGEYNVVVVQMGTPQQGRLNREVKS